MLFTVPRKLVRPSYAMGYARSKSESANPGLWDGLVSSRAWALGASGDRVFNIVSPSNPLSANTATILGRWTPEGWVYETGTDTVSTAYPIPTSGPWTWLIWLKWLNTEAYKYWYKPTGTQQAWWGVASAGKFRYYGKDSGGVNVLKTWTGSALGMGDVALLGVTYNGTSYRLSVNNKFMPYSAGNATDLSGYTSTDFDSRTGTLENEMRAELCYNRALSQAEIINISVDPLAAFRRKDQTIYLPSAATGFNRRYYDAFIARSA